MKLEVGKAANDGFAACGHPVRAGQDVLRIEHDGHVTMTCTKRHCAGPFYEADAKLDELGAVAPNDHAALAAKAEGAATAASSQATLEWSHVDKAVDDAREAADKARVAVEMERAYATSLLAPGAELDRANLSPAHAAAEQKNTDALREHYQRARFRDLHHSRMRTPAFEAAVAWLHTVRSA